MLLCEAAAGARLTGRGASIDGDSDEVGAQGLEGLEEMREGLAGAGRILDGDPRAAVAEEVEAAEHAEAHRHAMILIRMDGNRAVGGDASQCGLAREDGQR